MAQIYKPCKVEQALIHAVETEVERLGYQLWELSWLSRERIVRLFISNTPWVNHITHADCMSVSREVEPMIDQVGLLGEDPFHIEVSSLGSRPYIRTLEQLRLVMESPVELTDKRGKKLSGIVTHVEHQGKFLWHDEGCQAQNREPRVGHISDFKRIRLKHDRF